MIKTSRILALAMILLPASVAAMNTAPAQSLQNPQSQAYLMMRLQALEVDQVSADLQKITISEKQIARHRPTMPMLKQASKENYFKNYLRATAVLDAMLTQSK